VDIPLFLRIFLDLPAFFVKKTLLFSYACTKLMIQVVESGTKWSRMALKWLSTRQAFSELRCQLGVKEQQGNR